jgi:hypothetical protein
MREALGGDYANNFRGNLGRPGASNPPLLPLRWVSVVPLYPWQDLCNVQLCRNMIRRPTQVDHDTIQQVPGGAFACQVSYTPDRRPVAIGCWIITTVGHVFAVQTTRETLNHFLEGAPFNPSRTLDGFLSFEMTERFLSEAFDFARDFYQQDKVERPGYLQVMLGFDEVLNFRMYQPHPLERTQTGKPFVDVDYRQERTVTFQELLDGPEKVAAKMLDEMRLGFDLSVPESP